MKKKGKVVEATRQEFSDYKSHKTLDSISERLMNLEQSAIEQKETLSNILDLLHNMMVKDA